MKKLILASLFLIITNSGFAAVSYVITSVSFRHDASLGTFNVSGTDFGYIVGGSYSGLATDSVTGNVCAFSGEISLANPLSSFPTKAQVVNKIEANAVNTGIKKTVISCLADKSIQESDGEDNIPTLEGTSLSVE